MNLAVGIVGLPNVGKSTLFNALLKKQAALAANYPFATIEPNVGIVPVPDQRLEVLADIVEKEIASPKLAMTDSGQARMTKRPPIVPATVEFLDIAGLVKGAAEGAGLGNKFLSHIREVQIIAHVVRAFEDENVVREGSVDVKSDYQTIQTELMLADLSTIAKIKDSSFARASKDKQKSTIQKEVAEKLFKSLNEGIPARDVKLLNEEREIANQFFLLSAKPEIVVLNVEEEDYKAENISVIASTFDKLSVNYSAKQSLQGIATPRLGGTRNDNIIVICAKIESELSELSQEEQKQYLHDLGLEQSGLERLIKKAYETLGLISFLTAGEKEVRAWTIQKDTKAVDAAGVIHTDFENKFIKAEVVSFDDFVAHKGWKGSREAGRARLEGRDYIVRDGDVVEFKIGT